MVFDPVRDIGCRRSTPRERTPGLRRAAIAVMVSEPPGQLVARINGARAAARRGAVAAPRSSCPLRASRGLGGRSGIGTGWALGRRCRRPLSPHEPLRAICSSIARAASASAACSVPRGLPCRLGLALDGPARLDDRPQRRRLAGRRGPTSASQHMRRLAPCRGGAGVPGVADPSRGGGDQPSRDIIARTSACRRLGRNPIAPPAGSASLSSAGAGGRSSSTSRISGSRHGGGGA